ncbi:isoprenyl transferase [Candidatus Contubernalis alkaliaceticus]|uniref:isoprenyl transferase n=1 Tax=Candidatus Contubernalis alkaliaceticus TaxID=338645 RepID=UPI001F4BFB63|nr:isoprenyl transferase [Candidatus Contubernalis alkalaceticus]UNC91829.1 isoprenyl transferase [Candidatus Contubernalis alkalaceticus]
MSLHPKEKELYQKLDLQSIPHHVAIIMDGNGRWARKRGLPRIAGHRAGVNSLRETIRAADQVGVKILTLYTFSTENWKRPSKEVRFLMKLPEEYLSKEIDELCAKNVCIKQMGEMEGLPEHTRNAIEDAMDKTAENTGLIVNFALNYGSRGEIVRAVKKISRLASGGSINEEDITEEMISRFLYSGGQPDPDLLIRPSGELRLSNFLLWQMAYTEFWFSETYWPDFKKEDFLQAILDYQKRNRRYGGLTK